MCPRWHHCIARWSTVHRNTLLFSTSACFFTVVLGMLSQTLFFPLSLFLPCLRLYDRDWGYPGLSPWRAWPDPTCPLLVLSPSQVTDQKLWFLYLPWCLYEKPPDHRVLKCLSSIAMDIVWACWSYDCDLILDEKPTMLSMCQLSIPIVNYTKYRHCELIVCFCTILLIVLTRQTWLSSLLSIRHCFYLPLSILSTLCIEDAGGDKSINPNWDQ